LQPEVFLRCRCAISRQGFETSSRKTGNKLKTSQLATNGRQAFEFKKNKGEKGSKEELFMAHDQY